MDSSTASSFLPLDYHNLNQHRQQTGKTDCKVRGKADCYYYSCMIENGKHNNMITEIPIKKQTLSKAVINFKNSSLIKTGNNLKNDFKISSKKNYSSERYDYSQRTLDHSITQKLFDDMGNIAGSSENNISYYSNRGVNLNKIDCPTTKLKALPYSLDDSDLFLENSYRNNYRDSEKLLPFT
ncbi:hypothetical protein Phum_PHUM586150 [Pediculus humanus corporis]|uniref:Uncharacterized protein n=1 Tax=Pediculus humanus subsp. corporis TaxID=121224 RepID=E0W272_PEDHC|nr:uncharacterized protein Phum_PHUM586150 [Pediculus humanus corporis]EEB19728.1 hypothetical protein Phum_PHUM586150 [Pediculus humanus corporis]